jgi:hypothetical protein
MLRRAEDFDLGVGSASYSNRTSQPANGRRSTITEVPRVTAMAGGDLLEAGAPRKPINLMDQKSEDEHMVAV